MPPLRAVGLTPRETDVLERIRNRMTSAAIASDLGISIYTVRKHISCIHRKKGVCNIQELLAVDWQAVHRLCRAVDDMVNADMHTWSEAWDELMEARKAFDD